MKEKVVFHRMTRQREMLITELRALDTHPTADELFERLRRHLPHISLATVYRNLEDLVASGVIRKLETRGRKARYDGNIAPHSHVRCIRCGRIDDVMGDEMGYQGPLPRNLSGYEVLGCHVDFDGICPRCKERERQADGNEDATSNQITSQNNSK